MIAKPRGFVLDEREQRSRSWTVGGELTLAEAFERGAEGTTLERADDAVVDGR